MPDTMQHNTIRPQDRFKLEWSKIERPEEANKVQIL